MNEKHPDFPTAPQAALLVLALFVVDMIVWAAVHDAQGLLSLTPPQAAAIASLLASGCMFASVLQFKGLTYREVLHPSHAGIPRTLALVVPPVLMLVPALVLLLSGLSTAIERALPMSASEEALFARMAAGDLATMLLVCLIAPVVEEMLFRGIILRSFLHQYERQRSIWGSAALFGAAHLNVYQFAAALLVGALSGWLYERGRSLLPCIALHAAFNTAVTVLQRSRGDDAPPLHEVASPAAWAATLALAAAGSVLLLRVLRPARRQAAPAGRPSH